MIDAEAFFGPRPYRLLEWVRARGVTTVLVPMAVTVAVAFFPVLRGD